MGTACSLTAKSQPKVEIPKADGILVLEDTSKKRKQYLPHPNTSFVRTTEIYADMWTKLIDEGYYAISKDEHGVWYEK